MLSSVVVNSLNLDRLVKNQTKLIICTLPFIPAVPDHLLETVDRVASQYGTIVDPGKGNKMNVMFKILTVSTGNTFS